MIGTSDPHPTGLPVDRIARDRIHGVPVVRRELVMLASGALLYFFANVHRVAVPGSVFDLLQRDVGATAAGVAALGPAFMYVYALAQLVVGQLVDRYGGARLIAAGGALFCLGSLLFPHCERLPALLACRAAIGLGASTLYLGMVRELLRRFPGSFSVALGALILIGYTGGIVANAPFVLGVEHFGWRAVMASIAALSTFCYIGFVAMRRTLPRPEPRAVRLSLAPFIAACGRRWNRRLILFCSLQFGLYYVLQTVIGKKFLEDYCRMGTDDAALVLTAMGVLCAVSGMASATLCRLLGDRSLPLLRGSGILATCCFLLLTGAIVCGFDGSWLAVPLCILAAVSSTAAISIPLLQRHNPEDQTGTVVSIFNGACFLVVALFGHMIGALLSSFEPIHGGERMVYGRDAYLAIFALLAVSSCVACWQILAFRSNRPSA